MTTEPVEKIFSIGNSYVPPFWFSGWQAEVPDPDEGQKGGSADD